MSPVRAIAAAALIGLAGCDSGTEDDTYQPDELPGEFRDSRETRNYYPDAEWATGRDGEACVREQGYFESRSGRVRVYGSTAYSETTFRVAATEIDNRIGRVLDYYGWRWYDFVYARPSNTPYPNQILVCLNNALSHNSFATPSLSGISLAPYHMQWPEDSGARLDHALFGFVQENMAGYPGFSSAPAWLAEGQAASASGMDAVEAYQHYDQNPIVSKAPDQEHSALAYNYLVDANGVDAITVLWLALRDTNEQTDFQEIFDALSLKDRSGAPLTYERLSRDYHDLLNETY